jgi:hypothetical protein
MQKVYGLISDNGDGSSSMYWFKDKSIVENLLENDESFYANEGVAAETLVFPDDFDLISAGFWFLDDEYAEED